MQYIYYTLTALAFPVPSTLKQTITALQITQFVVGTVYALAHLFVAFDIPISVPYLFVHNLSSVVPSATSAVASAVSSATASANPASFFRKLALRAAGEEGLSENVRNYEGDLFGIDAIHSASAEKALEEVRYKMEYQKVNCLDTSGQVYAILLNVVYLAPLT